MFTLALLDT